MTTIEFNKESLTLTRVTCSFLNSFGSWQWKSSSKFVDSEQLQNQFNTLKWEKEKVSYSALIWEIRCENWIRNPRKLQDPLYLAWPIFISDLVSETFENTNECWQASKLQDQHSKRLCCRQFSNLTISQEGRDLDCLE